MKADRRKEFQAESRMYPVWGVWPYLTTKANITLFVLLGLFLQCLQSPSTAMATRANTYSLSVFKVCSGFAVL